MKTLKKLLRELSKKHSHDDAKGRNIQQLGDDIGYIVVDEKGNELRYADCGIIENIISESLTGKLLESKVIKVEYTDHNWMGYKNHDKRGYYITIEGVAL